MPRGTNRVAFFYRCFRPTGPHGLVFSWLLATDRCLFSKSEIYIWRCDCGHPYHRSPRTLPFFFLHLLLPSGLTRPFWLPDDKMAFNIDGKDCMVRLPPLGRRAVVSTSNLSESAC